MARRYSRSRRPSRRRSYSSGRRYSSRGRATRRSSSRRSPSQTLRLVLQQPGAGPTRPPFGTFAPTALAGLFGQGDPGPQSFTAAGAPHWTMGGPGVPGARMVINRPKPPVAPSQPQETHFQPPPGYRLVPELPEEG